MNQSVIEKKQARMSILNQQSSLIVEAKKRNADEDKFMSIVKIYEDYEKRRKNTIPYFNMATNFKLKTKKQQDQIIEEKNNNRRSRKDQQGRDYICGCGKSYLSYPALYTHIKQKHQGKQPQNTTRLNSNGPSKRGRPRRMRVEESIHSIEQNPKVNELPKVLTNKINKQALIVFQQYDQLISGSIMADEYLEYPKFCEQIELIKRQNIKQLQIQMPIDKIMAIYLYNMSDFVNLKFFTILEEFFVYLRHCVNKHYKKVHKSYQKISGIYSQEPNLQQNGINFEYSQKYCSELIPLISQYFIVHYLPHKIQNLDQQLVVFIMYDFCYWLYDNKLTHLKLSTYSSEVLTNINLGDMQFQ